MFVSKSKYDQLKFEYETTIMLIKALKKQIDEAYIEAQKHQNKSFSDTVFTKDEINTLLRLSHPDKHNGLKKYSKITQKLLAMRKQV